LKMNLKDQKDKKGLEIFLSKLLIGQSHLAHHLLSPTILF